MWLSSSPPTTASSWHVCFTGIHDDQRLQQSSKARRTVKARLNLIAFLFEPLANASSQFSIILHQQNAHFSSRKTVIREAEEKLKPNLVGLLEIRVARPKALF